ncbi:MAG TPA: SDR family NAD(P)-dependent oxidoreductase, partial [Bacteroidales bacterium]|nr:SDR family NAD(P)-dependent oxidoreductase [Bacteroidales bacterium]
MNLNLDNKLSLVTGSTAGIGYAIATSLAREGASVVINGRSQASVDDAVVKIKSNTGGNISGFAGDLGIETTAEQLAETFPDVEILV